ncbi:MAG: heavy metal translocating P-type ATPase [Planctomycetes bacterium]|nr:heavy metal translocating P-type ATPase [Planctomycetota bacterium]
MAHEHAKSLVEAQEGRAGTQIILTFVGGVLLINAAIAYWLFPGMTDPNDAGRSVNFYADTMAIIAALLLGVPLVVQAFKDLWSGHTHMDELAALAVIAAFSIGAYIEAGAIAFFMIVTTLIEHRTALGARKSIESLVRLTPTKAHRVFEQGEQEVDAKDLKPGDIVIVRPGDNIPGDGQVIQGTSTVNQANITGESLPVDKADGDEVFGGTINMTGVMRIRITKAGHDTTLGRVKDLILQAEMTRIPAMRILDQYANWYTPVILMLAGIVFFFTRNDGGMERAISMLVVACPCAIILAGPTAMVAALSAAARLGVLVKNVTDLEVARKLTAIVFDKTGTLTTGQLEVSKLTPAPGVDGAELLTITAAAEQNSKHPVARAVVNVARRARLNLSQPSQFEEVSGRGVRAIIDGKEIRVGRETWLREQGIDFSGFDGSSAEGLSLLHVTREGKLIGWVGLEDKTRADAAKSMDDLRAQGLKKLVMVTGDRWSVAKRVAAEMHCTDVQAEVLPAQKLELVDDLKARGYTVAVVGDGVNDAPALAAGDISIAMGAAGSDVAIHSASIALMNNNLNRIPFLIRLSRHAFSVVRQNLIFSVCYVVLFETLAAFGLIPPIVAVIFHLLSSFVVVFNSARLVRDGEDLEQAGVVVERQRPTSQGPRPAPVAVS